VLDVVTRADRHINPLVGHLELLALLDGIRTLRGEAAVLLSRANLLFRRLSLVALKQTREEADLTAWKAWMHTRAPAPGAKESRREAGAWLTGLRTRAGLSQTQLAEKLGLKYSTFISQVENGYGRVPTESMRAWAEALGVEPSEFARGLIAYYDPELHRLLLDK
jgi:DNA-binding XRE family transcriptional regulator